MKQQIVLLSGNTDWAPWIKSFVKWISNNAYWFILAVLIIAAISIISNWVLAIYKYILSKRREYEYLICEGIVKKPKGVFEIVTETRRKGVHVRIDKKTGMYYFMDLDGNWYKLRKKHRDQIEESRKKGIPEFDIPQKREITTKVEQAA